MTAGGKFRFKLHMRVFSKKGTKPVSAGQHSYRFLSFISSVSTNRCILPPQDLIGCSTTMTLPIKSWIPSCTRRRWHSSSPKRNAALEHRFRRGFGQNRGPASFGYQDAEVSPHPHLIPLSWFLR